MCTQFRALLLLAASVFFASTADAQGQVNVQFVKPENFKDFTLNAGPLDKVLASLTSQIDKHLKTLGQQYLLPGETLDVTIKDFDMAGGFEPWRLNMQWTRIISDVYPPKVTLQYTLKDPQGKVIAGKDEVVTDLNYRAMVNVKMYPTQDSLRYEKALLQRWFEGTFGEQSPG